MMMLDESSEDECGFYVSEQEYMKSRARTTASNNEDQIESSYTFISRNQSTNTEFTTIAEDDNQESLENDSDLEQESRCNKMEIDKLMKYHQRSLLPQEVCSFFHEHTTSYSALGSSLLQMRASIKNETLTDVSNVKKELQTTRELIEFSKKGAKLLYEFLVRNESSDMIQLQKEIKSLEDLPWNYFIENDLFMIGFSGKVFNIIGLLQKCNNINREFLNKCIKFIDLVKVNREAEESEKLEAVETSEETQASLKRSSSLFSAVADRLLMEMDNYENSLPAQGITKLLTNFYRYLLNIFVNLPIIKFFF